MQGGHGIEAAGAEGGNVACVKPFSFRRGETSIEIRKGTFLKLTRNRKETGKAIDKGYKTRYSPRRRAPHPLRFLVQFADNLTERRTVDDIHARSTIRMGPNGNHSPGTGFL